MAKPGYTGDVVGPGMDPDVAEEEAPTNDDCNLCGKELEFIEERGDVVAVCVNTACLASKK